MPIKLYFTLVLIISITIGLAQPAGYTYGKHFLLQSSQVTGTADLSNFPVLINVIDPDLRTTANGGRLENVNGFDVIFTAGDCSTPLDFQIEKYTATTGELVVWVKIPILSSSTDTGIHLYYGNSSIATNPSSTATWSAGYDGVWHLHNNFTDASGNANNGTNNGSTNASPAHNSADGQNFVDPNHWIELTNHPNRTGSFSYSAWFLTNDRTRAGQRVICDDQSNANGCHAISLADPGSGRIRFYIRGLNPVSLDTPVLVANSTWYYIAVTYNNTTGLKQVFLDGTLVASATVTGTLGTATGNASIGGEVASGESGNRFHGDIDEVRSIPQVLSAGWIGTEFNNQDDPSSFYTISGELLANDLCVTLPIELLDFSANEVNNEVELVWSTLSETNNAYFEVLKSEDGQNWISLETIEGAGTSSQVIKYETIDRQPIRPLSYYKLKQVDFNGDYSFSKVQAVHFEKMEIYSIYPNPSANFFTLTLNNKSVDIEIYNSQNQLIETQYDLKGNSVVISTSNYIPGVYILHIIETGRIERLKLIIQ